MTLLIEDHCTHRMSAAGKLAHPADLEHLAPEIRTVDCSNSGTYFAVADRKCSTKRSHLVQKRKLRIVQTEGELETGLFDWDNLRRGFELMEPVG